MRPGLPQRRKKQAADEEVGSDAAIEDVRPARDGERIPALPALEEDAGRAGRDGDGVGATTNELALEVVHGFGIGVAGVGARLVQDRIGEAEHLSPGGSGCCDGGAGEPAAEVVQQER